MWMTGLILALLVLVKMPLAQQANDQIKNEIHRLEKIVSSRFNSDEKSRKTGQEHLAELATIRSLIDSNHLYWALRRLKTSFTNILAIDYSRSQTEIVEKGQEAFDSEWLRVGESFTQKSEKVAINDLKLPIAIKAIAEISLNQSKPYYHSSRLYSQNTSINSGLFYLGRAVSNLDYALFCQALKFDEPPPPPRISSLEPYIADLEEKVVEGYQKTGFGSAEKEKTYNRFIFANMTIKMVRELEKAGLIYGAFYEYLEALLHYELIGASSVGANQVNSLLEKSAKTRKRLSGREIDHSIGLIFWQMAKEALDQVDTMNVQRSSLEECASILDTVLPKYFEIIERGN